jgi:RNA-directed DNA polymerase
MNETVRGNGDRAQTRDSLSTKLNRLSETARNDSAFQFKNIAHLIDVELLEWSFQQLRRDAAAGVDGLTPEDFEKNLRANLADLHRRLREGRYRALPLKRTYIEKEDGKRRPLSIPALEDKIVQRAAAELLTRIYEKDFLPCSYGYRPGRGPHDALDAIQRDITFSKVSYVLDADISDYFGSIIRSELMTMLQKRIADKHLLALIGKWLHVGYVEDGRQLTDETGTYQGSVISPILANIYLHEVLDLWIEGAVKPRLKGELKLYRFADDLIVTFELKEDADRFMQVLPKRFEKFGLKLHPDKTKLIEFGRLAWARGLKSGSRPSTFNFLGLTHYCGASRKGKFMVKVKTMGKRLTRGLKRVALWCKRNRHQPVRKQRDQLRLILLGHYAYYGRRSNFPALAKFSRGVRNIWKKWLGYRGSYLSWEKMLEIEKRYPLPKPRLVQGSLSRRSQMPLFGEII